MWTELTEQLLIQRRAEGISFKAIATEIGKSLPATYQKAKELRDCGRLQGTFQATTNKYTRKELIEVIQLYKSRDACPNKYRNEIVKQFGSWSAGLKEAGLTSRIGGIFDPELPITLYLLKFDGFYKIGVTQRQIEQRFAGAPSYTVLDQYCSDLDEIIALEKEILSKLERTLPSDSWFERNGKTECFLFPFDPTLADLI